MEWQKLVPEKCYHRRFPPIAIPEIQHSFDHSIDTHFFDTINQVEYYPNLTLVKVTFIRPRWLVRPDYRTLFVELPRKPKRIWFLTEAQMYDNYIWYQGRFQKVRSGDKIQCSKDVLLRYQDKCWYRAVPTTDVRRMLIPEELVTVIKIFHRRQCHIPKEVIWLIATYIPYRLGSPPPKNCQIL